MDDLVKNGLVFELGGGLLVDTAGNNTITNNGATLTADHNGRANRAWAFDGADDRFEIAPVLSGLQKFTIVSGFLKPSEEAGRGAPILSWGDNTNGFQLINYVAGDFYFYFRTSGATSGYNVSSLKNTLNTWNMFAATFDGTLPQASRCKYFLNGVQGTNNNVGTVPTAMQTYTSPTFVGFYGIYYQPIRNSVLLIYNRALTESEIKKLYNYWRSH